MAEPALAYLPSPAPCPALDAILALDEYSLPASDDQPLPDGRIQQGPLGYSRDAIRYRLRELRHRVAVEGDMFIYYIGRDANGGPALASVSPDIFVVFGVPDRPDRNSYVLWNEAEADIRFVLEIASPSTRRRDHTVKREIYASLDVTEYFLYDPPGPRRIARILGLKLRDGAYEDLPVEVLPNGTTGVRSETTGLVAYVGGDGELRWFDPAAGEDLRTYDESERQLDTAERQLDATARQLDATKTRVAELEAQVRKLTGED